MALNWGDVALNLTAGAIEKDEVYRKEQLEQRFKELQDNKELYRALATTRYSKDLDKYYKEVESYDKLQSAYANISQGNLSKDRAAYEIVMATPNLKDAWINSGTGKYGDAKKDEILASVVANFKDREKSTQIGPREEYKKTKRWYEFSHPEMELTSPKQEDYFQAPDYWSNLAKEIESKEMGPLKRQLVKLMRRKENHPAEVDLDTLDQKAGTEIKKMMDNKTYKSTNMKESEIGTDADTYMGILMPQFNTQMEGVVAGGGVDKDIYLAAKNIKETKIHNDKIRKQEIFSVLNTMDENWQKNNARYNEKDQVWEINPSGNLIFGQMKELYNNVSNDLFKKTFYQGGSGNPDDYTYSTVINRFKKEFAKRRIDGITNKGEFWLGGMEKASIIIGTDALPLGYTLDGADKENLQLKLNEYVQSGEFIEKVGKGQVTDDFVEDLLQKKAKEILFPDKTPVDPATPKIVKNLTVLNVIDLAKLPGNVEKGLTLEDIIEDLKKGNATFKEGVVEELLSMLLTEDDMTYAIIEDSTSALAQAQLRERWHLMPKELREKYPLITEEE